MPSSQKSSSSIAFMELNPKLLAGTGNRYCQPRKEREGRRTKREGRGPSFLILLRSLPLAPVAPPAPALVPPGHRLPIWQTGWPSQGTKRQVTSHLNPPSPAVKRLKSDLFLNAQGPGSLLVGNSLPQTRPARGHEPHPDPRTSGSPQDVPHTCSPSFTFLPHQPQLQVEKVRFGEITLFAQGPTLGHV